MAKRDPHKTARNKEINTLKNQLRDLLPRVLLETKYKGEASLNATIGSKSDAFIDLKHEVINSAEEFTDLWLHGLEAQAEACRYPNAITGLWSDLCSSESLQDYLFLFLRRSYLRHFEELSKARPLTDKAEVWIGQNNADWGLLVTPRFVSGKWENDKSEIRHFKPRYWSIGHVLETGLLVPGKLRRQKFGNVDDYLDFFLDTLVRVNGSKYGDGVAERYVDYVRPLSKPEEVLLLIPELRYAGIDKKHKYRLDFCVIDVDSDRSVGFELSPWSSHGQLGGKHKSLKELNEEAKGNFEKEVKKCTSYFRGKGITTIIFTDNDLTDLDGVFAEIREFLTPRAAPRQLSLRTRRDLFSPKRK